MLKKSFAQVISFVFHPLFMPFYGVVLIFYSGSYLSNYPSEAKKAIFTMVFLTTVILPLSIMPVLYFFRAFKTIEMTSRQERIIPYAVVLVFYYFSYFILKRAGAPAMVISMILASVVTLSMTLIFAFRWKISAHAIGLGGLTGALIAISDRMMMNVTDLLIVVILLSGMVGAARLVLNAHREIELYSGYLMGAIACFIIISYF